jgi:hypothetical protein
MLTPTATEPTYHGDQRTKLPVIGTSGLNFLTTNYTMQWNVDFPIAPRELFISNDGNSSLTFTVNCDGGALSWLLQAGEVFDERLPIFYSVAVSASDKWRYKVRGNIT